MTTRRDPAVLKITSSDAAVLIRYLGRVIPRGPDEADELHALILALSRAVRP
jgi:hypothetical protein